MTAKLEGILLDKGLHDLVARYTGSGVDEVANKYAAFAHRLDVKHFVIPVTGVQGCGKSSLLNALLFDRPVLPIDADETTSVPVEAVWAEKDGKHALVRFHDGRTEKVKASQDALSKYVDNRFNPGNEMGVEKVILESSSELLKTGMVLVDLPGKGSLTAQNSKTTDDYLQAAVGIFFLMRTVPPLTQSESLFVALNWSRLPLAVFVQNKWTDESVDEAEDGRNHNILVLKQISEKCHIPLDSEPEIHLVTVYDALKASLSGNENLSHESGLYNLRSVLLGLSDSWPQKVRDTILQVACVEVSICAEQIKTELLLMQSSEEDAKKAMEGEQKRFDHYIAIARSKCRDAIESVSSTERSLQNSILEWVEKSGPVLRNNMRTKMRAGITDGSRLDRALYEEGDVVLDDIYADLLESVLSLEDRLKVTFEDMPDWSMSRPDEFSETIGRKERRRFESITSKILEAGGAAGGALKGAAIGATLGSAVPVVGNIVGGIVGGLLGMFVGKTLGVGLKRIVINNDMRKVEPEVFSWINSFLEKNSGDLSSQVSNVAKSLSDAVENWEKKQVADFERERDRKNNAFRSEGKERNQRIDALKSDEKAVDAFLLQLQEVSHG